MKQTIYKFISEELAVSFCNNANKMAIILGDDNRYWVTTIAIAERLAKAGYMYR